MKRRTRLSFVAISLLSIVSTNSCFSVTNKAVSNEVGININAIRNGVCNHSNAIHYERKAPTLSKPGHIEFYLCSDCGKSFYDEACTQEIENTQYGIKNKLDGRYIAPFTGTFTLVGKNIRQYLDAESDADIIRALRNNSKYNDQLTRTIVWEESSSLPYTVELAQDRDFSDAIDTYKTNNNIFSFDGIFIPGETYYYRVKDANDSYLLDDCSFKVDDKYSLRPMKVDGVHNMRDLGGWTAKNGKKIPYGKVYRGGELTEISAKGKETFLSKLGIKTEIDLREDGKNKQAISDPRLNYQHCQIWNYTRVIPDYAVYLYNDDGDLVPLEHDPGSPVNIKKIFDLMADPNNYPFYFHCQAGADRTGTICYLINGLLGVSYEDLTKDFELTTFAIYGNRYRSDVDEETMTFTDTGIYDNGKAIWGKLHEVMMGRYGASSGKLYFAIENYLKTACGVSDETIASVRYNILNEAVDFSD